MIDIIEVLLIAIIWVSAIVYIFIKTIIDAHDEEKLYQESDAMDELNHKS